MAIKKAYIYTRGASSVRGKNLNIMVYELNGFARPKYIDEADVNTGSYYGDRATAWKIIAAKLDIPMVAGDYIPDTEEDIGLYEVGNYVL